MRSLRAVDRSDVVLVLIDATEGVTEQDTKIAGYAHNQGKASIILVNKWDLIEKDSKMLKNTGMRSTTSFDLCYTPYRVYFSQDRSESKQVG